LDDAKAKVFDIAIQTGAIFAVILVYWQKIRDTWWRCPAARRFALNVLIGFLPAVVLGLLFGKAIKAHLFTPVVVASTFILGGFVILWAERRRSDAHAVVDDMTAWMRSRSAWCSAWPWCRAPAAAAPPSSAACCWACRARRPPTSRSSWPSHADRRGRLQPLQGARAAVHGRCAAVRRGPDVLVHQRLAVRALAAALHLHHSFVPFAWYRIVFGIVVLVTAWTGVVHWAA
jgi:undecaprenyl-diphosphatase